MARESGRGRARPIGVAVVSKRVAPAPPPARAPEKAPGRGFARVVRAIRSAATRG